jgi:hypothetical protein
MTRRDWWLGIPLVLLALVVLLAPPEASVMAQGSPCQADSRSLKAREGGKPLFALGV